MFKNIYRKKSSTVISDSFEFTNDPALKNGLDLGLQIAVHELHPAVRPGFAVAPCKILW